MKKLNQPILNVVLIILLVSTMTVLFFSGKSFSKTISWLDNDISANELIILTNEIRKVKNTVPLTENKLLKQAAKKKAKDLIKDDFFSHNSPDGKYFTEWIDQVGYQYQIVGENLATGFTTNKQVMKAWMESPNHQQNILNNKYKDIGIYVESGIINGVKQTIVVQIFGSQKKEVLTENFSGYQNMKLNFNMSGC